MGHNQGLRSLSIRNIVLIESAHLDFQPGLTVLTGETGSGKSAILKALALALGERADVNLVRAGCDKGRVEAAFSPLPEALALLDEAGIEHDEGSDLIISREIPGRAFVNQQMVQTAFLKKLASHLLDVVGQSANIRLTSPSYHLETVDLYGRLDVHLEAYQKSYKRCQDLQHTLTRLTTNEEERARREARLQSELEELQSANPQEGEDEELFHEYTTLSHSEELTGGAHAAMEALEGEEGALSRLTLCQKELGRMETLDPTLTPSKQLLEGVLVEVQELAYTLRNYSGKLEYHPQRLEQLSSRLAALELLKKRYGPDLIAYQRELEHELEQISGGEERLDQLQSDLKEEQERRAKFAAALTSRRKKAAKKLEEAASAHLRPLNLKEARFEVRIRPTTPTLSGGDEIEFFFAPNPGEGSLSVRKCASGGELSRLLLALKTALSGLERTPTLIFDEIDSGMGGETAVLVGQKLKTIATGRQVLCITHLPQVARGADHHFAIAKEQIEGRTLTSIQSVKGEGRKEELMRMQGGASAVC